MLRIGRYVFKVADAPSEFEQIHRLNYRTFVSEIPQHADPGTGGVLVDKFHGKSTYFIALRDDRLVGMLSAHDRPPFSVAGRLPDPGVLERPGSRPLECRLLAVVPEERHTVAFAGLVWCVYLYVTAQGYTHLYISGVQERVPLYEQLGFEALGPAVPCGQARFVPMVATPARMAERNGRAMQLWRKRLERQVTSRVEGRGSKIEEDSNLRSSTLDPRSSTSVCLLPGPVAVAPAVTAAFHQSPVYHRATEFIERFQQVRQALGELVGGRDVALFTGSGTLANEAVAATLAANHLPGKGVLLVNGEFGERLARQARRFGLEPRVLSWPWGQPWDLDEVEAALDHEPAGGWAWGVHLETSTGVLNDLPGLVRHAARRGVRVCADCVSSFGAVPLDLRGVHLASGSTGKALGAYAGIAVVFTEEAALRGLDVRGVPSYLDVPAALETAGPRYTFPSPALFALEAALAEYATPEQARARYDHYAELGRHVRQRLRGLGIEPLAAEECAAPVITTFAPPGDATSEAFVARCRGWGFAVGGQSGYLAERRLVQIATMGAVGADDVRPLFQYLERWLTRSAVLA
jgi:aspartate aminotransferase-like enzyme